MTTQIVGIEGQIPWGSSTPDRRPRKLNDTAKINLLGWKPLIVLRDGIESTYRWYLGNEQGQS